MITINQHNFMHSTMREAEEKIRLQTGLNIHLSVYINAKPSFSYQDVIRLACEVCQVTREDVCSGSRQRHLVDARRHICLLLRSYFPITMAAIGELLGGKDHSTILNLLTTGTELINSNNEDFVRMHADLVNRVTALGDLTPLTTNG